MFYKKLLFKACLAILFMQTNALAQSVSYPGDIIDFEITKQSDQLPIVKYGIKDVLVIEQPHSWRILVGIDLNTVPGDYLVYIDTQTEPINDYQYNVSINHKDYQMLTSTQPMSPQLTYTSSKIASKELTELEFYNSQQPSFPFSVPVKGKWSTDFGARHENNDSDKIVQIKNAISLTTTERVNVASPQHGIISKVVVNTNNIASVTIDHGRGLYSIITGLTDLSVRLGEGIPNNAVIGRIPINENEFSPITIHWQCVLNGVFINPNSLINL